MRVDLWILELLKAMLLIPVTLLPIINPVANASIFIGMTGGNPSLVRLMAKQIAVNCWFLLVAALLVGAYVLDFFGISLPIVRVGGGLVVAINGWRLLNDKVDDSIRATVAEGAAELNDEEIARRSFFPISFPLTVGPGTIAASIALGTKAAPTPLVYVSSIVAAVVGATLTALVIYASYLFAAPLLRRLGDLGTIVLMRLAAFILLCVGIEILWSGVAELLARG
ncbi:MAG TPA: MarC family protein [Herpetosiphonaceae bacterium]